jgi:hypothetical protein
MVVVDAPGGETGRRTGQPVWRIVSRCVEKDPADRFHSAHDLALALEAVAGSFLS